MEIRKIHSDKRRYMPLLLMGDEQENMVERYLERGDLFVMFDGNAPVAVCVVTREGENLFELKNLAVAPEFRRKGHGARFVGEMLERYAGAGRRMEVGTGEVPGILAFYRRCGFSECRRVAGFFTEHYDHPIVEEGVQLRDMVYLSQRLDAEPGCV